MQSDSASVDEVHSSWGSNLFNKQSCQENSLRDILNLELTLVQIISRNVARLNVLVVEGRGEVVPFNHLDSNMACLVKHDIE